MTSICFNITDIPKLVGLSFVASPEENITIAYGALYKYLRKDIYRKHNFTLYDSTIEETQKISDAAIAEIKINSDESMEEQAMQIAATINNAREKPKLTEVPIDAPVQHTVILQTPSVSQTPVENRFSQMPSLQSVSDYYSGIRQQLVHEHNKTMTAFSNLYLQLSEIETSNRVAKTVYSEVIKQNGISKEQQVYDWLDANGYKIVEKQKNLRLVFDISGIYVSLGGIADAVTDTHVIEIKNRAAKLKPNVPTYESLQVRLYMRALNMTNGILVQCYNNTYKTHRLSVTDRYNADDDAKIKGFITRYIEFITNKDKCNRLVAIGDSETRKQFLIESGLLLTQKMIRVASGTSLIRSHFGGSDESLAKCQSETKDPTKVYCIFDVETDKGFVVEFAYILHNSNFDIIEQGSHLVKRHDAADYKHNGINNITSQMLTSEGISPEDSKAIIEYVFDRASILVGYNCRTDLTSLNKSYSNMKFPPYSCTYEYIKQNIGSVSLESLYEGIFGATSKQDHRAHGDCIMLYQSNKVLYDRYPNLYDNINHFAEKVPTVQ